MIHLISDTGIQFHTIETEFDPGEQLTLPTGRPVRYSFCNIVNEATGQRIFDLLTYNSSIGKYIPVNELVRANGIELLPDGSARLDEGGVEVMRADMSAMLLTQLESGAGDSLYSFNSLASYTTPNPANIHERVPAFELLLGHWLPMPMFEMYHGLSADVPYGWCRVKIDRVGPGSKPGTQRYRFVWAFDTKSSTDRNAVFRPTFPIEGMEKIEFGICSRVSNLIPFMAPQGDFTVFSHYIAQLLGLDPSGGNYRYIGFYIYLINYIRLVGAAPEVTLYPCPVSREIPVDLVLDIGNSRTCGLLFEDGDFTRVAMLALRDLTDPSRTYEQPFDMRLVFRQADFANDIVIEEEDMFRYASMVRVGNEARRLVYDSLQNDGLWTSSTNYSSPKRYLWDTALFSRKWEFLTTPSDPLYIRDAENVYVPGLSDLFDASGEYIRNPFNVLESTDGHTHYSRASLMTFVMIEILQQALMQINSEEFRRRHGRINCRRRLRSIILTCPTAMPRTEQIKLRQCAVDAFDAMSALYGEASLPHIEVYPSVQKLSVSPDNDIDGEAKTWTFDEATCSQLVYLYAEIAERYNGKISEFFNLRGHVRPEFAAEGIPGKSVTIASVDVGAGTTDVMVAAYTNDGNNTVTPRPIFWDSYYVAGDDILKNIIQTIVIEGQGDEYPDMGSVYSALKAHLAAMSVDEISAIPVMSEHVYYRTICADLRSATTDAELADIKEQLARSLLRDFFGQDSTMMEERDRSCRVDFNTQISHPMAQFFMEQLRLHRPSRVYTYDEIFPELKPSAYLLDYFENHFGFRFESLRWRFDPVQVADIVKATMEKLMKQISMMLYAHHCDIVVLSGRPTSLDAVTELFVKYLPVTPDNLVRLNEYRVGQWFPLADPQGYFYDQKAVVAVGAMVGHLASTKGFNGLTVRFDRLAKE
ncbi:MAG: virulence factor SrfB, partial [Muribaculaceae bacterium]|nr:virulence factor SrfB [Muribaculaceae bacterium]